jgi:hypothetical protein
MIGQLGAIFGTAAVTLALLEGVPWFSKTWWGLVFSAFWCVGIVWEFLAIRWMDRAHAWQLHGQATSAATRAWAVFLLVALGGAILGGATLWGLYWRFK